MDVADVRNVLERSLGAADELQEAAASWLHDVLSLIQREELKQRIFERYKAVGFGTNALQIRLGDDHDLLRAHAALVMAVGGLMRGALKRDEDAVKDAETALGKAYRSLVEAAKQNVGSHL